MASRIDFVMFDALDPVFLPLADMPEMICVIDNQLRFVLRLSGGPDMWRPQARLFCLIFPSRIYFF